MTWSSRQHRAGPGLAVLTALLQAAGTAIATRGQPSSVGFIGYVLLIFSALALADRHQFPRRNFVIVAALTLAYHLLDRPPCLMFIAAMIGASAAIAAGHRPLVWTVATGSCVLWAGVSGVTMNQALTAAAFVAGGGVLAELATAAARPVHRAFAEQRRLAEERQRRQASEERLRIAAELHDVLGHHLSLINVRAGVGLHLMDREPEQARVALDAIQQTSAEALREVQAVLTTLYPEGPAAPRAPAPGLERLDELTADAGLPTRTVINGEPRPLPAGVDRAAYRIVQEALTNVRRHADRGTTATITIEYRPDTLMIYVDDDGGGGDARPLAPPGNGITGMRERAAALGGTVTAGPSPAVGWRVHADLPFRAAADDSEPTP